jgi:hypothetical protein
MMHARLDRLCSLRHRLPANFDFRLFFRSHALDHFVEILNDYFTHSLSDILRSLESSRRHDVERSDLAARPLRAGSSPFAPGDGGSIV